MKAIAAKLAMMFMSMGKGFFHMYTGFKGSIQFYVARDSVVRSLIRISNGHPAISVGVKRHLCLPPKTGRISHSMPQR